MVRIIFRSIHANVCAVLLLPCLIGYSQPDPNQRVAGIPVNYDEAKVGTYTLPDPLTLGNGQKVTSKEVWIAQRRPELYRLFEITQFGKSPSKPTSLSFNVFDGGTPVFGGKVVRKQVTIYFTEDTTDHKVDVLFYLPANVKQPVPLLLNISFSPNVMAADDPGIKTGWVAG